MMGIMAAEDDTFRVFRRALEELTRRKVPVSRRVWHVQRRIEDSYRDALRRGAPSARVEQLTR